MEQLRPDIIGSRALNASRKLHLPTYVATRFLLESVAGKKSSSWINEVIPRKYLIQDQPAFHTALKFKKFDELFYNTCRRILLFVHKKMRVG